jgi:hypothetical protein
MLFPWLPMNLVQLWTTMSIRVPNGEQHGRSAVLPQITGMPC